MSPAVTVLVDVLGHALLHSVWQVSLIAAVLWVVLRALEGGDPRVRYGAGVAAMLLAPALFVATAASAWDPVAVEGVTLSALAEVVQPVRPVVPVAVSPEAVAWQPILVGAWGCGVVVFSLLFLSGLLQTRRLKTDGVAAVEAALQARVDALAASLGMQRAVPVRLSRLVAVPQVVGALRPVILLPGAALSGLSPAQLESILLHELAHIRRGDLWVGLLQGLVEIGLFFHPGVWWISRRIRAERELCCDDVVAARLDPVAYARALLLLEERRASHHALAAAATDGSLKHRISRLVGVRAAPRRASRSFAAVLLLGVLSLLPTGVAAAGEDEELLAMVERFAAMTIEIEDEDDSRRRQDRALRDDLTAMVDAYAELEAHIVSLMEADPDRWAVVGPLRLAQAREALGMRIRSSDIPSYLNEEQSMAYQAALVGKGNAQLATAQKAYELALARAGEQGINGPLVAEIEAGLASSIEVQSLDGELEVLQLPPTPPAMTEAMALAEAGECADALALFEAAEAEAEGEMLFFVRYRKAWCHSDLGQHEQALGLMTALLTAENEGFAETTLMDLAQLYVRAGQLERGEAFFSEIGQDAVWQSEIEGL